MMLSIIFAAGGLYLVCDARQHVRRIGCALVWLSGYVLAATHAARGVVR